MRPGSPSTIPPGAPSMSMWGLEGGVVIVPYKTLERLGGSIGALAIRVRNESLIREMAEEIFKRYGLETYFSIGNHTYVFSRAKSYVATGAVYQLVPTLLIVLSLLNMLIASVYERVREIRILSSVGLSPLDVAAMFLAESVVYGILGGVLGYVAAMGIISGLSGTLRGLALNPSSSTVALSVGVAILATVASAIYPAFKASRVVVPSLERRWRIPTKPRGDEWTIPLPFVARDERELDGIMVFTMKLIKDHMGEEMPVFTTKEARFTVERRGDTVVKRIDMLVTLPPREAAIRQSASFMGVMSRGGREVKFLIKVRRLSGAYSAWRRANYEFVDTIRKHLLQWRALSPDEREKYIRERLGC